jgi:hypothetical protein
MQEQSETLRRALEAIVAVCGHSSVKTRQINSAPKAEQIEPPPPDGMAIHDATAWAEDFHRWAISQCVFRDRCFGAISALFRDFADWQVIRHDVPCTCRTFERLLREAGFFFADGLVYGLLLKADVLAMEEESE